MYNFYFTDTAIGRHVTNLTTRCIRNAYNYKNSSGDEIANVDFFYDDIVSHM